MVQAKERADAGQTQGQASGISNDMQAEWRMRAGSALDDLRLKKQEQYENLNIQVSWPHCHASHDSNPL